MPDEHARLAPSGASCWMRCPGALLAQSTTAQNTSSFAKEGSAAHSLAARTLVSKEKVTEAFMCIADPETGLTWSPEMCDYVQVYVDDIVAAVGGGDVYIENKVDFSEVVGVLNSFGTVDVVIVGKDGTLQIHDLKYGRGVAVSPEHNAQLMIYALGALETYDILGNIDTVTLGIHMPRKAGCTAEWSLSVEDLRAFGEEVKEKAQLAIRIYEEGIVRKTDLIAGETQCRWCNYKPYCPTIAEQLEAMFESCEEGQLDNPTKTSIEEVSRFMGMTEMMEGWIKAVRLRVMGELEAGHGVKGYKLVRGRAGARKWQDSDMAEKQLKKLKLKANEMYDKKLISPTSADKLLKKKFPTKWGTLEELITRSDGAITVAPETDKREAIVLSTASADDFDRVEDNILG